jgi:hypothetical protein
MIPEEQKKAALDWLMGVIPRHTHEIGPMRTIRAALQQSQDCEEEEHLKVIEDLMEGNDKLRAKIEMLVEALEKIRTDAAIEHDCLPPSQVMGNLLGFIEDAATNALKQFQEGGAE